MLKNFEKVFQHFFISLKKYVICPIIFHVFILSTKQSYHWWYMEKIWRGCKAAKRLQIKKRLISANSSIEYAHGAGALLTVKTKVVLPGYDGHSS